MIVIERFIKELDGVGIWVQDSACSSEDAADFFLDDKPSEQIWRKRLDAFCSPTGYVDNTGAVWPRKEGTQYYQLTVSEKQLRLINEALEEYFRIGMNQWGDLADRIAHIGVDFSPKNPHHDRIFDMYIKTRDDVRIVLESAGRILWPYGLEKQDESNLIAQDIWQVIRHQLWLDRPDTESMRDCVDSRKPFIQSMEPAPKCEKITDRKA